MLDELKKYLKVTWEDETTDSVLSGILERAKKILDSYASVPIDYDTEEKEKQLLFDLCRYIYNNAYEEFKTNFQSELIMLRYGHAEVNISEEE